MSENKQEAITWKVTQEQQPQPNLVVYIEGGVYFTFPFNVKRTLVNRFKYWILCKFFPVKIERWN
jgi:hypothetical protein